MNAKMQTSIPSLAAAIATPAAAEASANIALTSEYISRAANLEDLSQSADCYENGFLELTGAGFASLDDVKFGDTRAILTVELSGPELTLSPASAIFTDALASPTQSADDEVRALVIEKIKAWRWKSMRVTALNYFAEHIAHVPKNLRPYAHEVRAINPLFYKALTNTRSQEGGSVGDLFEMMPGAQGRGGKLAGVPIDPQEALARIERSRQRSRDWRRRNRAPG